MTIKEAIIKLADLQVSGWSQEDLESYAFDRMVDEYEAAHYQARQAARMEWKKAAGMLSYENAGEGRMYSRAAVHKAQEKFLLMEDICRALGIDTRALREEGRYLL